MLVPGSVGFRSLHALMDHDVDRGVETAVAMLIVAASIAIGVLFANVMVPATASAGQPAHSVRCHLPDPPG